VHTAIYTHGHLDHAYGLAAFLLDEQPRPRVVAHRATLARFSRYARTSRHNEAINARQFGGSPDPASIGAGGTLARAPEILPDTLYDDALRIAAGGLTFELRHCRGETDDHTWVWCPARGVLCPGDLFIWAVPNAGNPQKVSATPRTGRGLREMAALGARAFCRARRPRGERSRLIRRMLIETADYLDTIVGGRSRPRGWLAPHVDILRRVEIRGAIPSGSSRVRRGGSSCGT
jgi:glyoxylase-like metal-dependent hydrolase (beta-lactamase superfamily II)